jgi:maleamate amidohydrolase
LWMKSGWALRAGFGQRPVILVIDVNYDFTGDRPEPALDSIRRGMSMSCGEYAWKALPSIKKLLDAGRNKGLPVIYTTSVDFRSDGWDLGAWAWKLKIAAESNVDQAPKRPDIDGARIHDEIAPQPQYIVIRKNMPSAFHATPLNSYLTKFAADTILMVGTTTSGCVRASVLDAFAECYRVMLVEEGCFDRFESSHAMSLFDMDANYADVVSLEEVVQYIGDLHDDLFELPPGNTTYQPV